MALEDAKDEVDLAFTRKDLRGLAYENTFGGALSFLRRRYTKDPTGADVAVLGVPFDQAVTNRPGTRLGPRAIREASTLLVNDPPWGWGFDPLSEFAVVDTGDLAFDYARPAEIGGLLRARAEALLRTGAGLLTLGGDHSISLPILRACAAIFGPVALVQFDAHPDTWPDDDPGRTDHGTMFAKAVAEGVIDTARSVQIGIRTVVPDPLGIEIVPARAVHEAPPGAVAARIREIVGGGPAYLSFDIDALDPAFAPGTGTPVWGGLSSGQAAAILRDIAGLHLVGGDVVEVSPPWDPTGATAIAGAHAALEILCLWCWTRRKLK